MHLFFIRQSHLISSHDDQQQVCDTTTYGSHYILLHEQQEVSGIALYVQSSPSNLIS
jgi:hypothetical protein